MLRVPFWKRESLHEKLAREGGLVGQPPHDTTPRWGEAGIHGIARPREWDATAVADAPELEGQEASFTALPDGTLLVEGEGDVESLAEALESHLPPPYRAQAVRRDERRWAVGAWRIDVVELGGLEGKEIELTVHDGEHVLVRDGAREFGTVPELERLAAQRGLDSYVIRVGHLDEALWEVELSPL